MFAHHFGWLAVGPTAIKIRAEFKLVLVEYDCMMVTLVSLETAYIWRTLCMSYKNAVCTGYGASVQPWKRTLSLRCLLHSLPLLRGIKPTFLSPNATWSRIVDQLYDYLNFTSRSFDRDETGDVSTTPVLENPEHQTKWYYKYFLGKFHRNYVGQVKTKYFSFDHQDHFKCNSDNAFYLYAFQAIYEQRHVKLFTATHQCTYIRQFVKLFV
jgi:hypothetical protein